jgi:superfamily I DNA/RNA helicase
MFEPSNFQKDIFKFIENDNRNTVISAVAGSGKTTTLLKSLNLIPQNKNILFLAFNKSIANELKKRIGEKSNIKILTVHALGYNSIIKNGNSPLIENNKYEKIYNEIFFSKIRKRGSNLIIEHNFKKNIIKIIDEFFTPVENVDNIIWSDFKQNVIKLCDLARMFFVNLTDKKRAIKQIHEIAKQYSISIENNEHILAYNLIRIGTETLKTIDFTDMIFLPLKNNYDFEKHDFVFIDECQDLNTCQREIMLKCVKEDGGRFIAVGDPKQCIYSFAGADIESYDKLCKIKNTVMLPLSYTYRCGKKIVNFVKRYNNNIIPFEKNPEGEILDTFSYRNLKNGDMVLCRHSFPVVSLCVKLISMNKKAHVIGIDTGNFIIKTINDTKNDDMEFTIPNVIAKLNHNLKKIIEKIMTTHMVERSDAMKEPVVFMLDETIKIIESLTKENETPENVIDRVKNIFKETKSDGICLSTIHKSKGLEAERVFILHPELIPSNQAKTDNEIQQENNLIYVAYTRAINTLGFITDYNAFNSHISLNDESIQINEGEHIGNIGDKTRLTLTIKKIKEIDGKFGKTKVFEMVDDNGNSFSRFGEISEDFLIKGNRLDVGSQLRFYGSIKGHTEFNGKKITQIGKITF